jgi:WD40 repeat protein
VAAALAIGLGFAARSFFQERKQHQIADDARSAAEQQRAIAEQNANRAVASERDARRQAYGSDMILAQQALEAQDVGRVRQLLDRNRAQPGREDFRGWEWRYLWQQCLGHKSTILTRSRFSSLMNHNYSVTSLSLSPDGHRLAVAFADGQAELWDLERRKLIKVLQPAQLADNETDAVEEIWTEVAYSALTENVVISKAGGKVVLHDLAKEGETLLCSVDGEVRDLCYSPDGACVAVLYETLTGGLAIVVETATLKLITTVSLPRLGGFHFFDCVRLSPDHRRLYVSFNNSKEAMLRCVSVPEGETLWERVEVFQSRTKRAQGITAMAVSPDGAIIATAAGYETTQIHVSSTETGKLLATLEGHRDWVCDLVFSHNGETLVSTSGDQTVRLWDAGSWKSKATIQGGDGMLAVALTADGTALVTGHFIGLVMLWDPRLRVDPSGPITLRDEVSFAQALPGGAALLVRDSRQEYSLMDLATLNERKLPLATHETTWFVPPSFIGMQIDKNGWKLYQIGEAGMQLATTAAITPSPSSSIAYCAGKRLLAWTEDSMTIHITNVDHPSEEIALECGEPVDPIAISSDGSLLLGMNKKRVARVWDLTKTRRIAAAEQYFSPFGSPIMDEIEDAHGPENMPHSWLLRWLDYASLWNKASTGASETASAPGGFWPSGRFGNRAFAPDGCTFAVSTASGGISLYDARGPTALANLESLGIKAIYSIAFSSDGARLFAPNSGVWDIKSKLQILVLPAIAKNLYHAEWTEDGNTLLSGTRGRAGTFQLWRAPSWKQIEETERNGGGWQRP